MTQPADIDLDTRGTRPAFFDNPDIDALMTALLEVMSQLWASRDYAKALEKLLVDKGVLAAGEVDQLQWSAEEAAANHAAREAFLKDAFRAMSGSFQSVEARNREIDNFQSTDLKD